MASGVARHKYMFGWYCKYGYFLDENFSSLNDFNITDSGLFNIFISSLIPATTGIKSRAEMYDYISNYIGSGVDSIYGMCPPEQGAKPSTYDLAKSTFPSVYFGARNLFNYYEETFSVIAGIYIPSLNRMIVGLYDSSLSVFVYEVNGNDLILIGKVNPNIYPGMFTGRSYRQTAVSGICCSELKEDLTQGSYTYFNSNCFSINSFSVNSGGADALTSKLFITSSKPDFVGIPGPYDPGGDSGEGGGGGNFDDTSDPIPDSLIPTLSSSNTGFTRIYNPTLAQVQDLARYLWTDETVIQTIWNHIKQYFEDPMQAIIGFNLVPCAVPNGGTKNFALMYIDTGVSMTVAANQFVDVDCGTCEISEYFGSALDYSPYTKISCFLPFIGTVQLNTDEVMKSTLQVKYRIDICSGSCVAKILVNGNVLYQYSGHCAIPIPISASDFSSYVSTAVSVAKLAIGAAVGGGMGALAAGADNPTQQTNQVVTTTQTTETGRNPATGRQITLGTKTTVKTRESPVDQSTTQASFSGLTPSNIANTVGQIMTAKPHVEHSGSFSGNSGYLGVRRPYLIIQRPNMCMPSQYQQFNGFPSMITEELSGLKGFTRVQQVQLTGMSATNPEQAEILEMLKSGVII